MSIPSLRLLLAVTLALFLPLQGLAAVTSGICMSLGHHGAEMAVEHDHHHGHPAPGHDAAPVQDEHGTAHCGPCVACCAATSIAPAVALVGYEHAPYAAIAAPPSPAPGSLPNELDRPPLAL